MGQEDSNPYPTNNDQYQQPPNPNSMPPSYGSTAAPTYQSSGPYPPQQPSGPYPPQQPYGQQPAVGYYEQQKPYGYQEPLLQQHNDAVIVGVAPVEHRPIVKERFGEQLSQLPRRMMSMFMRPSVSTFETLKCHASWSMTLFLLAVRITWGIIIAVITYEIAYAAYKDEVAANNGWEPVNIPEPLVGGMIGLSFLSSLGAFLLMNGLFHGMSLCLGGGKNNGQTSSNMFLQLSFLSVLFGFPLDVISLLALIPFIGWVVGLIVFALNLLFFVYTLQAVYNISSGHAIGIIVFFIVVAIVCVILFAVIATASIAATLSLLLRN